MKTSLRIKNARQLGKTETNTACLKEEMAPPPAAHSPLPWGYNRLSLHSPYCLHDSSGPLSGAVIASGLSEQDADFILQACNAYPALVEALEGLLTTIDGGIRPRSFGLGSNSSYDKARSALAQAKKGQQ